MTVAAPPDDLEMGMRAYWRCRDMTLAATAPAAVKLATGAGRVGPPVAAATRGARFLRRRQRT